MEVNTHKNKEKLITTDYSTNIKLRLTALAISGFLMLVLGVGIPQLTVVFIVVFLMISCYTAFELSYMFYKEKTAMIRISPPIILTEEVLPIPSEKKQDN